MRSVKPHLAEIVKNLIKKEQYFPLGDFGDVVHALAGIITDPRILV